MNLLDGLLVVGAIVYALSGYHQGFVVGAASTAGLLVGGLVGVKTTPVLLDSFHPGLRVSFAALLVVLIAAFVGQGLGAFLGGRVRTGLTWRPARVLDALSGSALSVSAMLLIAWVLGVAVSGVQVRALNQEVRTSVVLRAVDAVLPGGSDGVLSAFNSLVDSSRFPRYLEPFAPERIKDVPPPSRGVARRPAVTAAKDSVVKVLGAAPACGRNLEGSGFVYRDGRVMTNAHVVAGVDDPVVRLADVDYPAQVVYYDPDVDVAVLDVADLGAPVLRFADPAESKDPAAVLGFPENGPYDVQPARVRDVQTLRSPDIYGEGTVYRDAYSVYALVRQGNSGGPLVDRHGAVLGVVFAASVTDARTGYALTADELEAAATTGAASTSPVDTGDCTA